MTFDPSRVTLLLSIVCYQTGAGMMISMLALYALSVGATPALASIAVSCFGAARLMVNYPAGIASEKFGRRAVMIVGCTIAAFGAFAIANVHDMIAMMACLLLTGAGSSMFLTSSQSAAADLARPNRMVQDMAGVQAATMMGVSMGPALGGMAAAAWGLSTPYYIHVGIAAVTAAWLLFAARFGERKTGDARKSADGGLAGMTVRTYVFGLVAFTVSYVRISANWTLLPLIGHTEFGLHPGQIGLILTSGTLANVASLPFIGRITARLGQVPVVMTASALNLAALVMMAYGGSPATLWLASILFGASSGLSGPTLAAYAATTAPPGQTGRYMGMYRMAQDAGIIIGPILTGVIVAIDQFGIRGGLLSCLALAAVTATIFWRVARFPDAADKAT